MIWSDQQASIGFIANDPFVQELSGEELLKGADDHYYYLGSCYPSTGEVISLAEAPTLGVRMQVETHLSGYNLVGGQYGIIIIAKGKDSQGDTAYEVDRFTSADMYGNPYAYNSPFQQEKAFNFTNLVNIERIEVWAWQDREFINNLGELIPIANTDNIFLSDITLSMGMMAQKESLSIYNYDKLTYGVAPANAAGKTEEQLQAASKKQLRASWAIKIDDELKVFNEFNTSSFESYNFRIRWYRRAPNTLLYDNYGGEGWEILDFGAEQDIKKLKILNDFNNKYTAILNDNTTTAEKKTELVKELLSSVDTEALGLDANLTLANLNIVNTIYGVDVNDLYGECAPINHFVLDVSLDTNSPVEVFKAIVFYNGTYMVSNELTFTNEAFAISSQDLIAIDENIALLIYRPLLQKLNEQQDEWGHKGRFINSFYHFAENNAEIANIDGVMPSKIVYAAEVFIREGSALRPLQAADYQAGSLKWSCSINSASTPSMITNFYTASNSLYDLYNFDALNGERNAVAFFEIDGIYRADKVNNTINVSFTRGGALYRVSKLLTFGHQSMMGSKYNATISIINPSEGDHIPLDGKFALRCAVIDGTTGEEVSPLLLNFSWKLINGDNGENDGSYEIIEQSVNGIIYCESHVTATPYPPIVECSITNLPDINYPLIVRKGLAITTDNFANETNIYCPDRIQFNSDGSKPLYQRDPFSVYNLDDETYIYPAWTLNFNDYFCLNTTLVDTTRAAYVGDDAVEEQPVIATDEVEAAAAEDFAAAGIAYYDPSTVDTEYTTGEEYGQSYDEEGNLEDESLDPELVELSDTLDETCPIGYKLVPKAENIQWEYNMQNVYLYLSFTLNDGTYFAQAIVLDRNEYVSSLVNQWDGKSLILDEENSALMSNIMAVGTKDRNNRFTGIMMGDWTGHNDGSMDVPGLYGYQQGAQSFGFLTTGQAFLGQYGKGRIFFDGNYALISNADKTNYINLNPEPGFWGNNPMRSTGPSSSYFLYSQVPKYYNLDEDDTTEDENGLTNARKHELFVKWYQQFAKDQEHDYFIVDPNRGILTTGGIGANWGYVGNWIIDNGYLEYIGDDYAIYIGRPTTEKETGEVRPYAIQAGIKNGTEFQTQFAVDWKGAIYSTAGSIGGFDITENKLYGVDNNYNSLIELDSSGAIKMGHINDQVWALTLDATQGSKTSIALASGECELVLGAFNLTTQADAIFSDTTSHYSGIVSAQEDAEISSGTIVIPVSLGSNAEKVTTTYSSNTLHRLTIDDTGDNSNAKIELISGMVAESKENILLTVGSNVEDATITTEEAVEEEEERKKLFVLRPTDEEASNILWGWDINARQISTEQEYVKSLTAGKIFKVTEREDGTVTSDEVATKNWVDTRIQSWLGQTIEGTSDGKVATLTIALINKLVEAGIIKIENDQIIVVNE